jgi:hypothetical protein
LRHGSSQYSTKLSGVSFCGNKQLAFNTQHVDTNPILNKPAAAINAVQQTAKSILSKSFK